MDISSDSNNQSQIPDSINNIISELNSRYSAKTGQIVSIDLLSAQIMSEYAESLCESLLEDAFIVSQSRKSNKIDEKDIALILAKSIDIEIPGSEIAFQLHNEKLKNFIQEGSQERKGK